MILTAVGEELTTGPFIGFLTSRLVYSGAGSHSELVGTWKVEGTENSKCRGSGGPWLYETEIWKVLVSADTIVVTDLCMW